MPEIRNLGTVLQTDENGYLISEADASYIVEPWKSVVEDTKNTYLSHIDEEHIHSMYVRGTVARGKGIEGVSDVDTFVVTTCDPDELDLSWGRTERKKLEEKHSFVSGVEFDIKWYDEVFGPTDGGFEDRFTIKTQSACVYGEGLSSHIEPCKADVATARRLGNDFESALSKAKNRLNEASTPEEKRFWCRWMMKRILRGGFLLVMPQEQGFTRDLYPSYERFARWYPEKASQMRQALEWAINPTDEVQQVLAFLETFGSWLSEERERVFNLEG